MICQAQSPIKANICQFQPQNLEDLTLQEDRMLQQNDANDDHCFKCRRKGQLYCCDKCFRAFHKVCVSTKRFSKVWSCEYCNQKHLCSHCQEPLKSQLQTLIGSAGSNQQSAILQNPMPKAVDSPSEEKYLKCTICFRSVHRNCVNIPSQILYSQVHFFVGSKNFVCKACLKHFGFKYVLKHVNSQQAPEGQYYFVKINSRSPIHCGWFEADTIRELPKQSQQMSLNQVEVFEVPVFQKVIRMKIPHKYKHRDLGEVINNLLLGTSEQEQFQYGSCNNFYFLVLWQGGDYANATWQDQSIIFKNSRSLPPQLIKYLLYRKLQLAIQEKKPLQSLQQLFNKYLPQPTITLKKEYCQLYQHFKKNQAEVNYIIHNNNYNDTVDFVVLSLQEYYAAGITLGPTLLVCGGMLTRWQKKLKEACCQLNVVTLKGLEAHISELKHKQITYETTEHLKFQVMLMPEQRWNKQKKYLANKIFNFSLVILDENVKSQVFDDFLYEKPFSYQRRLYILDQSAKEKPLLPHMNKHYNEIDVQEQTCVYDLATATVLTPDFQPLHRVVNPIQELPQIDQQNQYNYENSSTWRQLQRVIFLKYVMTFGFNSPSNEMFVKLVTFSKNVINLTSDYSQFNNYSKRFLSALNNYKQQAFHPNFYRYYFFDLKGQLIFKRIVRLHQLKIKFEACKNRPEMFPSVCGPLMVFQGSKTILIRGWDFYNDYILAALILEKGFGRWLQICVSKDWIRWASSCHFNKIPDLKWCTGLAYQDYLKKLLLFQKQIQNLKEKRLEDIISERAHSLLKAIVE